VIKLPKAPHLDTSKCTKTDLRLDQFETEDFLTHRLTFQEKLDGYNVQLYVTKYGKISMKHGGVSIPKDQRYSGLRKWASDNETLILNYLSDELILFGEWMQYRNTIFYNNLPSLFIATDVYEKKIESFWSSEKVQHL
jgi:hypothetical protein